MPDKSGGHYNINTKTGEQTHYDSSGKFIASIKSNNPRTSGFKDVTTAISTPTPFYNSPTGNSSISTTKIPEATRTAFDTSLGNIFVEGVTWDTTNPSMPVADISAINFRQLSSDINANVEMRQNIDWNTAVLSGKKTTDIPLKDPSVYEIWTVSSKPTVTTTDIGTTTSWNVYTGEIFSPKLTRENLENYQEALALGQISNSDFFQSTGSQIVWSATSMFKNIGWFSEGLTPKGVSTGQGLDLGGSIEYMKAKNWEGYKDWLYGSKYRSAHNENEASEIFKLWYDTDITKLFLIEAGSMVGGAILSKTGLPLSIKGMDLLKESTNPFWVNTGSQLKWMTAQAITHPEAVKYGMWTILGGSEILKVGMNFAQKQPISSIVSSSLFDIASIGVAMEGMRYGMAHPRLSPVGYEDVGYWKNGKWVSEYSSLYFTEPISNKYLGSFGVTSKGFSLGIPNFDAGMTEFLKGGFYPQTPLDVTIWEKYVLPTKTAELQGAYKTAKDLGLQFWSSTPKFSAKELDLAIKHAPEGTDKIFLKTLEEHPDVQLFGSNVQRYYAGGQFRPTGDLDVRGLKEGSLKKFFDALEKNLNKEGFSNFAITESGKGYILDVPVKNYGYKLTFTGFKDKAVEGFNVGMSPQPYRWEDMVWNVWGHPRDVPIDIKGVTGTTAGEQMGNKWTSVLQETNYAMGRRAKDVPDALQSLYERVSSGGGSNLFNFDKMANAMGVNPSTIPSLTAHASLPSFIPSYSVSRPSWETITPSFSRTKGKLILLRIHDM